MDTLWSFFKKVTSDMLVEQDSLWREQVEKSKIIGTAL
jgi:hypothetical protein